jgi:hypothetical protein
LLQIFDRNNAIIKCPLSNNTKISVDTNRLLKSLLNDEKVGILKPQDLVKQVGDRFEIDLPHGKPVEPKFEWTKQVQVPSGNKILFRV